jgi:hypothetical protein
MLAWEYISTIMCGLPNHGCIANSSNWGEKGNHWLKIRMI